MLTNCCAYRQSQILSKTSLTVTYSENCYSSLTSSLTLKSFQKSKLPLMIFKSITVDYRDTVKAKLENFKMLEETLRNLKIKVDSKMID
jgi:hypothetical protein